MKHLYYLSTASFSQVDLGVLAELSKHYKITYSLIMPPSDVYLPKQELAAYCNNYGIAFRPFVFNRRQRDVRIGLEFIKIILDLRKSNPDIIYTVSLDIPIISILCLFINRYKTVVGIHDVEFHSGAKFHTLLTIGRAIVITKFKTFQVFSTNQEMVFRRKYPKKTVFNIPLSLGYYGDIENNGRSCALDEYGEIKFLFFGNILPYKGLENLLHAVNKLSKKYSNFKLTIAGQCDNWATKYKPIIKNNRFVTEMIHHIDSKAIANLFLHAHYLVLPYKDATQSGPLMMAYNFNVPVIASNIASFEEVVKENTTGYIYDLSNATELERTLEAAILRNKNEYRKLLKHLKRHVEIHHSAQAITEMYREMFDNTLSTV